MLNRKNIRIIYESEVLAYNMKFTQAIFRLYPVSLVFARTAFYESKSNLELVDRQYLTNTQMQFM